MKKILFFTTLVLIISTQIVKAQSVMDATLKQKGVQTDASTVDWLASDAPDVSLINMDMKQFAVGFKDCISEYNQKYNTFTAIDGDVIYGKIIPKLYTKYLVPGKIYWFSRWNYKTKSFSRWQRAAEPGEKGVFYPGWDDPIMSVYCWNFGYPNEEKFVPPPVPEGKTEYVFIPGTKKVIVYGADTVETTRSSVQIDRTNTKVYQFNDNQSFQVETNAKYASNKQSNDCGCQEQKSTSCGCTDQTICRRHYDEQPKKIKKPFFNTVGGRIFTHVLAIGAGYGLRMIVENNLPNKGINVGNPVTQGPLDEIPAVLDISQTQGPLYQ